MTALQNLPLIEIFVDHSKQKSEVSLVLLGILGGALLAFKL
jgi:hypothetical protein